MKTTIVMVILLGALISLQHFGLEQTPEQKEEQRVTRIDEIKASSALPAYLGSLFMGSLRVVVVDIFWIQLKSLLDENRYYEAQELMEMISWLQPRNPEVWDMIGWSASYNIPEGGIKDPEERWRWIRFGLRKFYLGSKHTEGVPHLKNSLGWRLSHRMTMSRSGWMDVPLIERIEQDDQLQRELQDLPPHAELKERLSPFRLSILWLEKTKEQVNRIKTESQYSYYLTQTGLYIHPDSVDGYIRQSLFQEGIYQWWVKQDAEAAKKNFRLASQRAAQRYRDYPGRVGRHDLILEKFYGSLPEIVDLHYQIHPDMPPEEKQVIRTKMLRRMEAIMKDAGSEVDDGFISQKTLGLLKQRMGAESQGRPDTAEFNDGMHFHSTLEGGRPHTGTIAPHMDDVDTFAFQISAHDQKFRPRTFDFDLVSTGTIPLRFWAHHGDRKPILDETVAPGKTREFKIPLLEPGALYIYVESTKPSADVAPASGYTLTWHPEKHNH